MNLAHLIIEENGEERVQTLKEHNRKTGKYASDSLRSIHMESCASLAGLLHDGKGTEKFQNYLKKCAAWDAYEHGYISKPDFVKPQRGSVNHTFAGVIYILERYHGKDDLLADYTSEIIACAIGSHHGLFDCQDLDGRSGFDHRIDEEKKSYIQYEQARWAFENEVSSLEEIDTLFAQAKLEVQGLMKKFAAGAEEVDIKYWNILVSFIERMLSSALMYADRRDTAEFTDQSSYKDIIADWDRDISDFERLHLEMTGDTSRETGCSINAVRRSISDQCRKFAKHSGGIYRLNVPTGGGKTLSSLRYSLYHAREYAKKRIIYVIPLLTIIDQNAADIEKYLPEEVVLEHHSDVVVEGMNDEELRKYDLVRDRWSAPVIVTTLVQILNILFSDKTQYVARMRALSDAVIIFDEVQSVPMKTLALFNSALNFLSEFCNTTIILCSATQPEFDKLTNYPLRIRQEKMVDLSEEQMRAFDRQRYHDFSEDEITIDELAEKIQALILEQSPLMVVCNTKSEARNLYIKLKETADQNSVIMHLSAGMCKAHRKVVIQEISEKLKKIQNGDIDEKFVLVTTQLVEAGVDLSFRSVIRILAGNDNLVQSAGRCNRSNEYGAGDVYLVRLVGEDSVLRQLPYIQSAQKSMLKSLHWSKMNRGNFAPVSEDFIAKYYQFLFADAERGNETKYPFRYKNDKIYFLANILSNNLSPSQTNTEYQMNQPFKTAGRYFSVFDDDTYDILVPYKKGVELIENIRFLSCREGRIPSGLLKQCSDYSVQIYEWQKRLLVEKGMLEWIDEAQIFVLNSKAYDEYGLNTGTDWKTGDMIF